MQFFKNQLKLHSSTTTRSKVTWLMVIAISVYYLTFMVLAPISQVECDWVCIQEVWDRWQTLNSAMIALLASSGAIYVTQYNEKRSAERKFLAARVLLPQVLSELTTYLDESTNHYLESIDFLTSVEETGIGSTISNTPSLPNDCREIFSRCIECADEQPATFMGAVLSDLQVVDARIKFLRSDLHSAANGAVIHTVTNLEHDLFYIGHIKVLVDRLFPYARGSRLLNCEDFALQEYSSAFKLLPIFRRPDLQERLTRIAGKHLSRRATHQQTFSGHLADD